MKKIRTKKIKAVASATPETKSEVKPEEIQVEEYVVVDHPKNLEVIPENIPFAVRIGASECSAMDISIDDQPWQPCRNAVGYWWFDWEGFTPGSHQIVARLHKNNGEFLISKRRRCKVA